MKVLSPCCDVYPHRASPDVHPLWGGFLYFSNVCVKSKAHDIDTSDRLTATAAVAA